MPILEEGLDEAEFTNEQIKKERPRLYRRPEMLAIRDGDSFHVRFITDKTLSANVHQFKDTKDKPDDYDGNWPSMMWAICQNDKMFRLRDPENPRNVLDEYEEGYGNCWLCTKYAGQKDPKYGHDAARPTYLTFGLAVLRKVRYHPDTKKAVGFADELVEFRPPAENGKDGKQQEAEIVQIPKIIILAQRYEPLWAPVKATAFTEPYTFCDKDFTVARKGKQDKDWTVAVAAYTQQHAPGTTSWWYPQVLEMMGFYFREWFTSHGTQDHYDRWFIPGRTPIGGYGRNRNDDDDGQDGGQEESAATAGSAAVDDEAMKRFKDRFGKRGS